MKAYVFVCLALFCSQVLAVPVSELYRSQVSISSQTDAARDAALKDAMAQTLVRVTGSSSAATSPQLADLLSNPSPYLLSYRYEQGPDGLELYAAFDQHLLEQAIWQRGFGVWGSERPTTLLWLAVQQDGQRDVVADSSFPELAKAATDEGKVRGLPVMLPLWDLDDKTKLDALDVWGKFEEPIADASSRYHAEQFVMARVSPSGQGFEASWQLDGVQNLSGDVQADNAADAIKALVDDVADKLSGTLAVKGQLAEQRNQLTLTGVSSAADYLKALDELQKLPVVADAEIVGVQQGAVTFSLQLRGDQTQLAQALSLSHHFAAQPDGAIGSPTSVPQYQYVDR
ncbi:DUF2066 domain-containing protein [Gallaecimonas mangrovi]|uniref:DUF2066 domain-containing protein n=1 Tax=Gallaecimonas mangrovi TaxID=2291597 RepID=UPI001867E220|nr:DUF2066 domain-containing protein [Gallaecimonas mangrovi]